jgi:hypothetical protein
MASYNCCFSVAVSASSNFLTVFEISVDSCDDEDDFLPPHIQPKKPPPPAAPAASS